MTKGTSSDRRVHTGHLARTVLPLLCCLLLAGLLANGCSKNSTPTVVQDSYPEQPPAYLLMSIWGTGADDVYVVGQPGVILHYDGSTWTMAQVPDTTLTAVWGSGADDVYACGHNGAIYHNTGSGWSSENSGTHEDLYDIGLGPYGEINAVGKDGTLLHRVSGRWSQDGNRAYRYNNLGVSQDTLVFSLDWPSITRITPFSIGGADANVVMQDHNPQYTHRWLWGNFEDTSFKLITAASPSDSLPWNYMGNEDGKIFHLVRVDGVPEWRLLRDASNVPAYPPSYPHANSGVWYDAADDQVYVCTQYGEVSRVAGDGSSASLLLARSGFFTDVWGSSADDIYVSGYDGILEHYDGNNWTQVAVPTPANAGKSLPRTDVFGRPLP